jgi:hypothetical protein
MNGRTLVPALVATFCFASGGNAQDQAELLKRFGATGEAILRTPEGAPSTAGLRRAASGARFLRDLKLEWKAFETRDGDTALGVGWDFDKTIDLKYFRSGTTTRGFGFHLLAKGSAAFTEDSNPQDFLENRLGIRFFQNSGGIVRTDRQPAAGEEPLGTAWADYNDRFQEVSQRRANLVEGQEEELAKLTDELMAFATDLDTQVYFDIALDAGLETTQRFDQRNGVFGLRGIFDVKAWNDDSLLAWANLFDYPFAMVRYLLDETAPFQPRGGSIPTILAGLDWIEPNGDDPRALAGDRDGFLRLQGELGFRTPIGAIGQRELHVACTYRIFHELGASDAIEAADLGTFDYFSASVIADGGLFVSYRTGRLPFDLRDDEAFELGFKLHF